MAYTSKAFFIWLTLRVTGLRLLRIQPKDDKLICIEIHEGPLGPGRQLIDVILQILDRLPTYILTTHSVNSFKRQLDLAWEELFVEVP